MKVVFHADDFGLMPSINAAVVEAHTQGVLGSTSLMVNADAAVEAASLAKQHPSLDVGLHLTLVEERPVLPPEEIATLVDGDHFWRHHPTVAERYFTGRWSAGQAVRELEAQWERCTQLGIAPSHVDGHQHLHLLPGVFPSVVAQARRRGVTFVRSFLGDPLRTPGGVARRAVLLALRAVGRLAWLRTPVADRQLLRPFTTIGFVLAGGTMTVDSLMAMLEGMRVGRGAPEVVEVMLHPGTRDDATRAKYGHWRYAWESDLALLCDRRLRALLPERGFEVTSFRALAAAHG